MESKGTGSETERPGDTVHRKAVAEGQTRTDTDTRC